MLTLAWHFWKRNNWTLGFVPGSIDMLVARFEDLLQRSAKTLQQICEHVELDFQEDLLPAPHHKILFGSGFRDRWYPLSPERALHYIKKAAPEELEIVRTRCGSLAGALGYEVPSN